MSDQNLSKSFIRKWLPLIILSLALVIIVIDTTLLNVALKTITEDLHTNLQNLQWVISAYSLTIAALTVTGGRLGDLYGRKKMFVLGAILFALGSLTASLSHNFVHLLIGESIIEGIGAALMMPATSSLLLANYKGRDRAIGFGVWGGMAAAGAAIGPVLGGYLTSHYSWRWAFRINVFVVILLLIGSFFIRDSKERGSNSSHLDIGGAVWSSLGLLSGVFGVIESTTYGWWLAKQPFFIGSWHVPLGGLSIVPVTMVLSIVLLIIFYLWEQRVVKRGLPPIVNMHLFTNKQFTVGAVTTTISAVGQTGILFALPIFLQAVLGLNALQTGIALLPLSLAILVAAPTSGWLSKHIAPRSLIIISRIITIIGLMVIAFSLHVNTTTADLIPGLVLFGIGGGLAMAQLSNITLSAISVEQAGEASGVNSTLRQVGASLGAAVLGAVVLATIITKVNSGIRTSDVIPSNIKPGISSQLEQAGTNVEFGGGQTGDNRLPKPVQNAINDTVKQATVDGARKSLYVTNAFVVLSFITAFWLPAGKDIEKNESMAIAASH